MPVFPPNYLRDQWFELNDPTLDPKLRDWLVSIADKPDGGYVLANESPSRYDPRGDHHGRKRYAPRPHWEVVGLYLMANGRFVDAIDVFNTLYTDQLRIIGDWRNAVSHTKACRLFGFSDCYSLLRHPVHAKGDLSRTSAL